jgi:monothiol glutaredoxin
MLRCINSKLLFSRTTTTSGLLTFSANINNSSSSQQFLFKSSKQQNNLHQLQLFQSRRFIGDQEQQKGGTVEASAETHPDFQPKPVKTDDNTEERVSIMNDIRDTIRDEPVVVFIKGLPECPVCSFSKKMVDILDALQLEYTSFDVLAHPVVRSYVKEVSDWSTIPQLFVKGEFVGGVDVIAEMAKKGQLQMMLEKHKIPFKPYHF